MLQFIAKRLLLLIPVILGATLLVFTIMDFSPGDPVRIILGDDATPDAVYQLTKQLGLDQPFHIRYVRFVSNMLRGDLGISYRNRLPVAEQILEKLPNTLALDGSAVFLAVLIGLPVGIISALRQYSVFDNITMVFTLLLAAAPVFWLGLMLVIIFALNLGVLPPAGKGVGLSSFLISLILPSVTLCGNTAALLARTTRSSMLEVMRQDYIDTARAKGIKEGIVTVRHMLKNALIPIITVVGLQFGVMLGGSVMVESIFSWPGVGRFVVDSIKAKDIPAVLGSVVTLAILFTIVNLLVDILYALVDPRIKSQFIGKRRLVQEKSKKSPRLESPVSSSR